MKFWVYSYICSSVYNVDIICLLLTFIIYFSFSAIWWLWCTMDSFSLCFSWSSFLDVWISGFQQTWKILWLFCLLFFFFCYSPFFRGSNCTHIRAFALILQFNKALFFFLFFSVFSFFYFWAVSIVYSQVNWFSSAVSSSVNFMLNIDVFISKHSIYLFVYLPFLFIVLIYLNS